VRNQLTSATNNLGHGNHTVENSSVPPLCFPNILMSLSFDFTKACAHLDAQLVKLWPPRAQLTPR